MQTEQKMSAIEAMKLSSQENRIVHLDWSLGLERDLRDDSEDSARTGDTIEFWGTTGGGSDWRVHLESVPKNAPDIEAIVEADDFVERVKALQREAGQHGDPGMANTCSRALQGDTAAAAECAQVMLDAKAME